MEAMKKGKAIAFAVVLAAAAAAVFLVGWVQIRVPRGSHALLVSKTSGWDESMRPPGTFLWRWEARLPTNLSVYAYRVASVSKAFSASGALPDADLYASFLNEKPSFSYAVSGKISASPSVERLPVLVRSRSLLTQASLDSWLEAETARAGSRIADLIASGSGDVEFEAVLRKGGEALEEDLLSRLKPEFPDLVLESVAIESSRLPDFALYAEARRLYVKYIGTKADAMSPVMKEIAESAARDQYERESLAKYGELLAKYPILVDFLAVRKGLPPSKAASPSANK